MTFSKPSSSFSSFRLIVLSFENCRLLHVPVLIQASVVGVVGVEGVLGVLAHGDPGSLFGSKKMWSFAASMLVKLLVDGWLVSSSFLLLLLMLLLSSCFGVFAGVSFISVFSIEAVSLLSCSFSSHNVDSFSTLDVDTLGSVFILAVELFPA